MDHIYPTRDYKEFLIKDKVKELRDSVLQDSEMPDSFEDISQILKMSEEEIKSKSLEICKVFEDYGKESARNIGDDEFAAFPEESLQLNCMKFLQKGNINFKEDRFKDSRLQRKVLPANSGEEVDLQPYEDAILTVRFYEPFRYTPCIKNHPRFNMEFLVLASNFLTELRDKISCICNNGPFFDISEYPTAEILPLENAPNSGFFFFHDTFYNDTRSPNNQDYSEVIRKWFKKFPYVRKFQTALMEDTKFEDLKIRIGYPCVYQHHGACEHIFCITSVDLIDASDSLVRSEYPKLIQVNKKRPVTCETCNQREAEFIVTNCPLHVKDPTKLCESCFFSFHYIDRTKKTCEFNAYRIKNGHTSTEISASSQNELEYEVIAEYEVELVDEITL